MEIMLQNIHIELPCRVLKFIFYRDFNDVKD